MVTTEYMTMTKNMTTEQYAIPTDEHTRIKNVCKFIEEYATAMLSAGATTSRIEHCVERISKRYDIISDLSLLPSRILLTVWDTSHRHNYSLVGHTHKNGINLQTVTELSRLSFLDIPLETACEQMKLIISMPRLNKWIVILLTALANLSFCRLFDGDWYAMGVVFAATVIGNVYKNYMLERHWDIRFTTIVAAYISAIVGSSCFIFDFGSTPQIALGTSVLWLVPGIRFINAISDMTNGHYVVSQSRMTDAVITTICLSLGLCLALLTLNIQWK